jgi:hypothetical protein
MINEPNTKQWIPGDMVIHDVDAKEHYMLMVVLSNVNGVIKSKYLNPEEMIPHSVMSYYGSYGKIPKSALTPYTTIYTNGFEHLLDPECCETFGIKEDDIAKAKVVVESYQNRRNSKKQGVG